MQLRRIINEENETYWFELDGLGQVVKETGFDGLQREYIRDGAGRVSKVLRPEERWTQYLYDGVGNVVKEEHHDETWTAYRYDADGLLIEALNENGLIQFKRDKAGRIVEESRGAHSIQRVYDKQGDCTQITSSLGADIRHQFDEEGNLIKLTAGESWQADWKRDETGLELHRQLTGNVSIRTQRDGFGREIRKSVGVRNIEQSSKQYQWGTGNRLQGIYDERTGKHTNFDYDAFDNLVKADYQEGSKVETIYRAPDGIGNLYETRSRTDRKYDKGGRLLEDPNYNYYYDCEGNLIFKEFKKPQGYRAWGKEDIEKKFNIKMKATGTGWYYKWAANGMLMRVVNPEKGVINFGYDALGRRTYKEAKQKRVCWLWDGNVPLHEWTETEREPLIDIVTWVFEDGTFVPTARITDRGCESIVTDYLGTPNAMFDENGEKTWEAQLDIYGRVRTFVGRSLNECPFRYQGQYEDVETGLHYNRFRYYDSDTGNYISQDPIGLAGGTRLYGYVKDSVTWTDPLGWHGNELGNIADSDLYHIEINGKTFKYGIANANPGSVTKTDIKVVSPSGDIKVIPEGTPVRLKQQLRRAYSNYDDVKVTTTRHNQISTAEMKKIETDAISAHVAKTGKVPSGNKAHNHLGTVADDFNGVHDLRKDTKMKNNKPKSH